MARASAQSPPCRAPSVKLAATSTLVLTAVLTASPRTEERRLSSPSLAEMNKRIWAARTTMYAPANHRPRSPKASGTQSAATRNAPIAPKIAKRTSPSSGSTTLVSHA